MNMASLKNEDQYEALREKGYSKEKSASIAGAPNSEKKGGKAKSYEKQTKDELYEQVKPVDINGRSNINKAYLIHALRNN